MDCSGATRGGRWWGSGLAGGLVLLFALFAAGPARATSDGTATLRLDRSEGPPGTKVTAIVEGYAECHAPSPAPAEAGGGQVQFFWEGILEAVGSAKVPASGSVEVTFAVPAEATPQKYSIVSVCMTDPKLTNDDLFVVTRSEAAVVPPETVTPATVTPKTVTPKTATPQLVRVPRVVGLKVADAGAKVSALDLVLRVTSGEGDVVASQSPTAGSMVGFGHAVRITLKQTAVAPVPNVAGEQPPAAGSAFPWWGAAPLSLVVLAFGAVTYRVTRRRLDQRWVRNKLRVVVPPPPAHAHAGVHVLKED